jgi:hypothetical protein
LATILGRSFHISLVDCITDCILFFVLSDYSLTDFSMTVPVVRQPNIGNGLDDQTNITLTLFNTILETASTRVELERSWEVIERDINIRERWEARQRQPRNQQ